MSVALTVDDRPSSLGHAGEERAARLLLSLGPQAAAIWGRLDDGEIRRIEAAMERLSAGPIVADGQLVERFQDEIRKVSRTSGDDGVWSRLSALKSDELVALVRDEPVSILAAIASRLNVDAAAGLIGALPQERAIDVMQRILTLREIAPKAEATLGAALGERLSAQHVGADGTARLASLLERLPAANASRLMAGLAARTPDGAERVRALMFTFEDLAQLGPAGIQTLLGRVERSLLALALKGADERTRSLLAANMTQRASDQLNEQIASLGPVRRREIENARNLVMEEVREMIDRGDLAAGPRDRDDDLIE